MASLLKALIHLDLCFHKYQDSGLVFGLSFGLTAFAGAVSWLELLKEVNLDIKPWKAWIVPYALLSLFGVAPLFIKRPYVIYPARTLTTRAVIVGINLAAIWGGYYLLLSLVS